MAYRGRNRPRVAGTGLESPEASKHANIPIIENLTPQYMPPYPPTVLVSLLDQPIVPEHLRVEIKHLEGRMVHVRFGALEEEETVVVDEFLAAV